MSPPPSSKQSSNHGLPPISPPLTSSTPSHPPKENLSLYLPMVCRPFGHYPDHPFNKPSPEPSSPSETSHSPQPGSPAEPQLAHQSPTSSPSSKNLSPVPVSPQISSTSSKPPRNQLKLFPSLGQPSDIPDQLFTSNSSHPAEENPDEYTTGGYHPVKLGERFHNDRYLVVRKLGCGGSSTVWLAHDQQLDRHVALKIVKSDEVYTHIAEEEIKLQERAASANPSHPGYAHVVSLLDHFTHQGPNGTHVCMVFEALGENLARLLTRSNNGYGLSLPIVRQIGRQLLLALDYLHRECNIPHTGIKPVNVVVCIDDIEKRIRCELDANQNGEPDSQTSYPLLASHLDTSNSRQTNGQPNHDTVTVKICDLGNSASSRNRPHYQIQTRPYRAPEVIIDAPWSYPVDIWSLGCLMFELCTGNPLFHTPAQSSDADHLHQIVDLLGPVPCTLISSANIMAVPLSIYDMVVIKELQGMQNWSLITAMTMWNFNKEIPKCLETMLTVDPTKRPGAKEILDDNNCWLGLGADK